MAAMHEAFVGLAKVRRVVALADLIGDDQAGVALPLQIPGMVEAWRRSRRICHQSQLPQMAAPTVTAAANETTPLATNPGGDQ